VGNPAPVGDQSLASGVWSLTGAGNYIGRYADQFHYVWQSLTGNGTLEARVTAQSNTGSNAQTGVMLRQSTAPGSQFYGVFLRSGNTIAVQARVIPGLRSYDIVKLTGGLPAYVGVARSGSTFSAYTSSDGVTWTYVTGSSVTISMTSAALFGLALTSGVSSSAGTSTLDSVSLTAGAPAPLTGCPNGWTCSDIGSPALAGSETYSSGVWTITGAGADIWGTS